jgi:hypothetical protein
VTHEHGNVDSEATATAEITINGMSTNRMAKAPLSYLRSM